MGGQWYLLGKEVDHRLIIYYKANSSIERVLYRLILGNILTILLFNIFSIFTPNIYEYLFWGFFFVVALFYSWPTRGKIIEESISGQFGEYRFLDSFERTVLLLSTAMVLFSIPEIPLFENSEGLKLYLDSEEKIHFYLWNFLSVNYVPFASYPKLFNLAWNFHFYIWGVGFFLTAFYALLRYFFSRRLSIMGVFAIVSTWTFSLLLNENILYAINSSYVVIWIWSTIWSIKSSTYRTGLFTGLVLAYGVMINYNYIWLMPLTLIFSYFYLLKDKTNWYKKQWVKYNSFGIILSVLLYIVHNSYSVILFDIRIEGLLKTFEQYIERKAFFSLFTVGVLMSCALFFKPLNKKLSSINFDLRSYKNILSLFFINLLVGLIVEPSLYFGFNSIWFIAFLCLIPLEWIFQSISRQRSKRNIIFVIYILVCLLDSHFEERVKLAAKMFFKESITKYIDQM
jgi:hypothetical protein